MTELLNLNQELIVPHGGILCERYLSTSGCGYYQAKLASMPSWFLTQRQLCDLELLLNGGFSPLNGFMNSVNYNNVDN